MERVPTTALLSGLFCFYHFPLMKRILIILVGISLYVLPSDAQCYLLDDFKTSIAVVKGGIPIQEKFNYNCVTQTMDFLDGNQILRLDPISQIDTLYLDSHKMIPYGTRFLDMVYRSEVFSLLADYKRKIVNDGRVGAMGIKTQNGVQNVDHRTLGGDFRQEWEKGVDLYTCKDETSYWLVRGSKMKRFGDVKSLTKLFPDKKEGIKEFTDTHQTDFNQIDQVLELLKFLCR